MSQQSKLKCRWRVLSGMEQIVAKGQLLDLFLQLSAATGNSNSCKKSLMLEQEKPSTLNPKPSTLALDPEGRGRSGNCKRQEARGTANIGALTITYTILWAPY